MIGVLLRWPGRLGGGTWKHGHKRSVRLWCIGRQISGGRMRGGILARRGLNCRSVPICQQGGRPASCKRLCSVWPFPRSQRILGEWRWTVVVQRKSCARRQISGPSVSSCVHANDLSFKICVFEVHGQGSRQLSRPLLLLPSVCENTVKAGSSFKPLKLVRFRYP